jgi:hypothetical protein
MKHPQAIAPKKTDSQRIAELEIEVRSQLAGLHVSHRNILAARIMINAAVLATGAAPATVKAKMEELAATVPASIRPDTELAEIGAWLDKVATEQPSHDRAELNLGAEFAKMMLEHVMTGKPLPADIAQRLAALQEKPIGAAR